MKLENLIIICFAFFLEISFLKIYRKTYYCLRHKSIWHSFFPKPEIRHWNEKPFVNLENRKFNSFSLLSITAAERERDKRKNDKISGNQVSTRKKYFFHSSIRDEKWLALRGKSDQENS